MDRFLRYAASAANVALIVGAFFIVFHSYGGRDTAIAVLLCVPPVLSLIALCNGPDREERRLQREVSKARLRAELRDLEAKK